MPAEEMEVTPLTYECGIGGVMHPHSVMHRLQELASRHAEVLGFGMSWMKREKVYWVLINFRMEWERLPVFGERVTMCTWPSGWDSIKALREFTCTDESGVTIFRAGSEWMVIDAVSGKVRTPEELEFDFELGKERALGDLKRLLPIHRYELLEEMVVPYSSLDINEHVNNTEYVRWGTDAARRAAGKVLEMRWMHISFNAQVFEGQRLSLFASVEDVLTAVKGVRKEDKKNVFLMEVGGP